MEGNRPHASRRARAGRRRGVCAAGRAGGDPVRRRDPLARHPAALRHRPGGAAAAARHPGAWPTGRWARTCWTTRSWARCCICGRMRRVDTLMHRHTNCCLRYGSGLAGAGVERHDHDRGQPGRRPAQQGRPDAARGRIAVSVYQAWSQGHVRITTPDPAIDPAVEERMLSDERDLVRLRDGVRRLRDDLPAPGVADVAERVEYGVTGALDRGRSWTMRRWTNGCSPNARTPSMRAAPAAWGTTADPRSVVDPACRVIGCTGLRVIDASIMPRCRAPTPI